MKTRFWIFPLLLAFPLVGCDGTTSPQDADVRITTSQSAFVLAPSDTLVRVPYTITNRGGRPAQIVACIDDVPNVPYVGLMQNHQGEWGLSGERGAIDTGATP